MKRTTYFIALLLLLTNCISTRIISIKDTNAQPHQYKKPLFITTHYYSDKSKFAQFFNSQIKTYKCISKTNIKTLKRLDKKFHSNNISFSSHIFDTKISDQKDITLNNNPAIWEIAERNNSDLVVIIAPKNMNHSYYVNDINNGGLQKIITYTCVITALNPNTKKEIWKAEQLVRLGSHALFNKPAHKAVSDNVFSKMMEDQIF